MGIQTSQTNFTFHQKQKDRKPARVESIQTRKGREKEEIYLKIETQVKNPAESRNPLQEKGKKTQNHHKTQIQKTELHVKKKQFQVCSPHSNVGKSQNRKNGSARPTHARTHTKGLQMDTEQRRIDSESREKGDERRGRWK